MAGDFKQPNDLKANLIQSLEKYKNPFFTPIIDDLEKSGIIISPTDQKNVAKFFEDILARYNPDILRDPFYLSCKNTPASDIKPQRGRL